MALSNDVISFRPSDEGLIFMDVKACTVLFSSCDDDITIEGDVTSLDDVISPWASDGKTCFDENFFSFDAAGFITREVVSFSFMMGDDSISNTLDDVILSVL